MFFIYFFTKLNRVVESVKWTHQWPLVIKLLAIEISYLFSSEIFEINYVINFILKRIVLHKSLPIFILYK